MINYLSSSLELWVNLDYIFQILITNSWLANQALKFGRCVMLGCVLFGIRYEFILGKTASTVGKSGFIDWL